MFYFRPTENGIGAELWGTYDDLRNVYELVSEIWGEDSHKGEQKFVARDQIISSFSYEIRKAFQGNRFKREFSHFSTELVEHFGCRMSWVHLIFAITAIRQNAKRFPSNKLLSAAVLQMEYRIEASLQQFDAKASTPLIAYLNGGIDQDNPYLYQFMRSIDAEFFELKGGKDAFNKLNALFLRAVKGTQQYNIYNMFLIQEAQRLGSEISEIDLVDDNIEYEQITW